MSFTDNKSPWGNFSSTLTLNVLLDNSNQVLTFSENLMHLIFFGSISWTIVPKDFCKSTKIKPVYFPNSKPFFILSVNNDEQDSVENDLPKPDWCLYKILFFLRKLLVYYE